MQPTAQRDLIARIVEERKPRTVGELAALIKSDGVLDEEAFVETVKGMVSDGSLKLDEPEYPIRSFVDYLFTLRLSVWFWSTIATTAIAILLAMSPTGFLPADVFRWIFGSIFLLFLPGYSCLQLLFPKRAEIRKSQKYLFSILVSLALLIMVGLVLNYSTLGIRLVYLLESVSAITIAFAVAAAIRLYLLNRV